MSAIIFREPFQTEAIRQSWPKFGTVRLRKLGKRNAPQKKKRRKPFSFLKLVRILSPNLVKGAAETNPSEPG